jgi:hypothetical protein
MPPNCQFVKDLPTRVCVTQMTHLLPLMGMENHLCVLVLMAQMAQMAQMARGVGRETLRVSENP